MNLANQILNGFCQGVGFALAYLLFRALGLL
jgi:Na+-translocating ferredoxin:NAD+ oxidoreductase RnfA subunit